MADEFPAAFLKDAIPRADQNRAGMKPPTMNMAPPAIQPAPAVKKQTRQRKPSAAPPQVPAQFQTAANPSAAKLNMIHQTLDTLGQGKIQHGTASPYANFDPWADAMVDPVGNITAEVPTLPPLQPDGPLVPSDDELIASGVQPAAVRREPYAAARQAPEVVKATPGFLQQTCRVSLELTDGSMTLPAIAVKESQYSVLMILRLDNNSSIFVPKPSTKLRMSMKDKSWDVYYPGTYVEIEELGIGLMTFIKHEGSNGEA